MIRILPSVFVLFLLTSAQSALSGPDVKLTPQTVLVKRGDIKVTYADFRALLAQVPEEHRESVASDPQRIQQILEAIAKRRLVAREARQADVTSDPDVAARVRAAEEDVLASVQLKAVAEKAEPADYAQQAREYYLTHQDEFKSEPRVDVCHVLIRTDKRSAGEARKLAEEVLAKAREGAAMRELAAEFSEDPSADQNQGCFEGVRRGQMVKPFEEAAFAMRKKGELAGPVETRYGFHVIELQEYHPARVKDFEQVRSGLVERMRSRYLDRVKAEYTGQLLRKHPPETDPDVMAALRDRYVVQPGTE